jgi:hypothetical protein
MIIEKDPRSTIMKLKRNSFGKFSGFVKTSADKKAKGQPSRPDQIAQPKACREIIVVNII